MHLNILKRVSKYWVLGLFVIVVIHLILISHLVFFPYPELFVYPYLTNHGLVPYRQIFDQHFPGLMFFPINLNNLGMVSSEIARYWHLFLIAISQILLFFTTRKFLKSAKLALIANLVYLIFQPYFEGYVLWIETFIVPLLLFAFYLLLDYKRKTNLFWAGFIFGIMILFKQVMFPFTLIVLIFLYLFNKTKVKILYFMLGLFLPMEALVIYITKLGIWRDFIYWTFIFNLTVFNQMGRKFVTLFDFIKITPVFVIPFIFLLYKVIKDRGDKNILLSIFYISCFFFVYARFDFIHLQPMLPFAIIVLVFGFSLLKKKISIILICLYLIFAVRLLTPFYKLSLNQKTLFFGDFEKRLINNAEHYAKPEDSIFVMGTTPHLYFLTNTLPPGKVFTFQFPWFMEAVEPKILAGLISDPPKVVYRDRGAKVQGMTLLDYFGEINTYIEDNYKVVDNISGTEVLLPK